MVNGKVNGKNGQGSRQRRLWENLAVDPAPPLKAAIGEVIKGCALSRDEIVDDMNKLALLCGMSRRATAAMLDKWTAAGAEDHVISLQMLRLFCQATGDNLALEVYAKTFPGVKGLKTEEDERLLEWAKTEIACRNLKKKSRRLAVEVGAE